MSRLAAKRRLGATKRVKRLAVKKKRSSRKNSRTSSKLRKRNRRGAPPFKKGIRRLRRRISVQSSVPLTIVQPTQLPDVKRAASESLAPLAGVIFSKDRALQLDATLRSLYLHALDFSLAHMKVLYTTSNAFYEAQYEQLKKDYPQVQFIKEEHFKQQLLSAIESYPYVMFVVDDCLFVRDFTLQSIMNTLTAHSDLIGFSLRLGPNIHYCYTMDAPQFIPAHIIIEYGYCKFDWTTAQHDFGYPLEVSSSIYRTADLLPTLNQMDFSNPNTLEGSMAANAYETAAGKHFLACSEASLAFCNPLNLVQNIYANRSVNSSKYSSHELALLFQNGFRIDVTLLTNFIPDACHQHIAIF